MDPGAIYAVLIAAALVACAALILVLGITRTLDATEAEPCDFDPDVGRCIIAGCTNWCEDTICSSCATHSARHV